ncbi:MAG: DUF2461 domain-containing protein [Bryobacteraceae bacterium]
MKPGFAGFPKEGIAFLKALKRHNQREWFQPRKEAFEATVRAPMVELVIALQRGVAAFSPDHAAGDPAKALYRIHRDTRFSNDKTPYKTHIAAVLSHRDMDKNASPGYYFSVGADEIEAGGGLYMMLPQHLIQVRSAIARQPERFDRIAKSRDVSKLLGGLQGARLTRPPKGFAPGHPAAEYLKFKQFFVYKTLDNSIATTPELYTVLLKHLKAMTPLVDFLCEALSA